MAPPRQGRGERAGRGGEGVIRCLLHVKTVEHDLRVGAFLRTAASYAADMSMETTSS